MLTNIKNDILQALDSITSISLKEMENVKLMRRTDVKFVCRIDQLADLLRAVEPFYRVLEICDSKSQPYETQYYDTAKDKMYHMHQCGQANRYKVRFRKYMNSKMQFLEVKNKNNKGETIKKRVKHPTVQFNMGESHSDFLQKVTPYSADELFPRLNNRFTRLMLVSKVIEERITIDFDLAFLPNNHKEWTQFSSICIIEVKRNIDEKRSDIIRILNTMKIKEMRFSKYCMGLAILDENIRQNRFKPRLLKLRKMIKTTN